MQDIDLRLNKNFTILRRRTGLKQKEFAKSLGFTQSYIARIESGKVNVENMSMKNGFLFAKTFGIPMEGLLDRAEIIADDVIRKRLEAAAGKVQ